MQAEDLELAAEFCKLVGTPSLLEYLGLESGVGAEEAQARLKARRKFMQGMQGNPKYKREALFLIRHFTSLNDVLGDLGAYGADARRRAESEHLPVIEMTVRGVLRSGATPTDDQIAYLRRNAAELGVGEATFRDILVRIAAEAGIALPSHLGGPSPAPVPDPTPPSGPTSMPPLPHEAHDLYQLLGISPAAKEDDVRIAHQRKMEEIEAIADPLVREQLRRNYEIAKKVLSNEAARRHYDVTASRTGPPARSREAKPLAATAPPVTRASHPGRPARLEILGDPVRTIRLGAGPPVGKITIRNGGDGQLGGSVGSEVRWLTVEPERLDPAAQQQTITVRVDPKLVPEGATSGAVVIQTDRGEKARVVFELRTGPPLVVLAAAAVGMGFLLMLLLGVLASIVL
jgi:hypothetical protein